MSTLHIFDFDDTLVRSAEKIRIIHADGTEELLSSSEFAGYNELPGDQYDFSAFDEYPTNATIVENVFAELRAAMALDGPGSVVILTARSNISPVQQFLSDSGIKGINVVGTGSDNPMDKARYILERVKGGDYEEVRVFEDNTRNIRTIRKVIEPTGIRLQTNRVTRKGVFSKG
jgi:hypothetical protein